MSHHFCYCFAVFDARIVCSFLHCLCLHRFILYPFAVIQARIRLLNAQAKEFGLKRNRMNPMHGSKQQIFWEMKRKDLKNFISWIRIFCFLLLKNEIECVAFGKLNFMPVFTISIPATSTTHGEKLWSKMFSIVESRTHIHIWELNRVQTLDYNKITQQWQSFWIWFHIRIGFFLSVCFSSSRSL